MLVLKNPIFINEKSMSKYEEFWTKVQLVGKISLGKMVVGDIPNVTGCAFKASVSVQTVRFRYHGIVTIRSLESV